MLAVPLSFYVLAFVPENYGRAALCHSIEYVVVTIWSIQPNSGNAKYNVSVFHFFLKYIFWVFFSQWGLSKIVKFRHFEARVFHRK